MLFSMAIFQISPEGLYLMDDKLSCDLPHLIALSREGLPPHPCDWVLAEIWEYNDWLGLQT